MIWRQAGRYLSVGLLTTAVGFAAILALREGAGLSIALANLGGYGLGWLIAFAAHRRWTFGHGGAVGRAGAAFALLCGLGLGLSIGVTAGLERLGLPFALAQAGGIAAYSTLVFFGARHVVFAPDAG